MQMNIKTLNQDIFFNIKRKEFLIYERYKDSFVRFLHFFRVPECNPEKIEYGDGFSDDNIIECSQYERISEE